HEWLERFWTANRMPTLLLEWATNGGITGIAPLKFEPDPSDTRSDRHRVIVPDPCYLDVLWDPHDVRTVLLYRFEYPTIGQHDGQWVPFVHRQDIEAVRADADEYGYRRILSWTITNKQARVSLDYGKG